TVFAGSAEAAHGFIFIGEFWKDLGELGDFHDFVNARTQPYSPYFTACFDHSQISSHQFTDARAIEVYKSAEVQNDALASLAKQTRYRFVQSDGFKKGKRAA